MKTHVRTISAAIVNGEPAFAPAVITVRRADTPTLLDAWRASAVEAEEVSPRTMLTLRRLDLVSVDRYGVAQTVDPGQTITLDLRAAHRGTFLIYCQLHPAHRPAELRVR